MNRTYDDWKADAPDTGDVETSCGPECTGCPDCSVKEADKECPPTLPTGVTPKNFFDGKCCAHQDDKGYCFVHSGPLPGTWAFTARMMAEGDDSGFDWDRWKDEMKERDWDE